MESSGTWGSLAGRSGASGLGVGVASSSVLSPCAYGLGVGDSGEGADGPGDEVAVCGDVGMADSTEDAADGDQGRWRSGDCSKDEGKRGDGKHAEGVEGSDGKAGRPSV